MPNETSIYGLFGIMHGGGKTLILMSPVGISALRNRIPHSHDYVLLDDPHSLPLVQEKIAGGLHYLIQTLNVVILEKDEWDAQKKCLGDTIFNNKAGSGPVEAER